MVSGTIPAGTRYGRWEVLITRFPGERRILCRCDCGTERQVRSDELGRWQSCGCLAREVVRKWHVRHGRCRTPEYRTWAAMIERTTNPRNPGYGDYGGRGITVCERWRDFVNFFADMGPRPAGRSIDRIDNDGNYEPGNCRWATPSEQVNNRRPLRRPPARWGPPIPYQRKAGG